jgi:hypothetical protein
MQAVLFYLRQDTRLELEDHILGSNNMAIDLSMNYFQVGAIRGIRHGNVMPFGMLTFGATLFDPQVSE